MRGRKPKPTKLKLLDGTRKDRINQQEPHPKAAEPVCPDWLPAEAKRKWRELAPELFRLGLLTVVDGEALAAYCLAWSELKQATERLQKEGRYVTIEKTGYTYSHPAVSQQRSALEAVKKFSALFGTNPADRGRIKVGDSGGGEEDALEQFMSGAKA